MRSRHTVFVIGVLACVGPLACGEPALQEASLIVQAGPDAAPASWGDAVVSGSARFDIGGPIFVSAAESAAGHGQFRFAGRVINDTTGPLTNVIVDPARLTWREHVVDLHFAPDAPNPALVRPGTTSDVFIFVTGANVPICAARASGDAAPLTFGFTVRSSGFEQTFDAVDVQIDCGPK